MKLPEYCSVLIVSVVLHLFNMQHINGLIAGVNHRPICYDLTYDDTITAKALVLFIHGFKGFKDWGHYPLLACSFAELGYPFLKFNFSHNGTTPDQLLDLTDTEAFGHNNLTIELTEVAIMLHHISNLMSQYTGSVPIVLVGHSRGGGIAIIKAAEDERIKGLITLASLSRYGHFFGADRYEEWRETGVIHVLNSRTRQYLPLYWQYMEDLELNGQRLNIQDNAKRIIVPWLIVHGTADESVPVSHALDLHKANPQAQLMIIEGANHTFGGKHPYQSDALPMHTLHWFKQSIGLLDKYFKA